MSKGAKPVRSVRYDFSWLTSGSLSAHTETDVI